MTSMRRRYVASTSLRRHVPAGNLAPPGSPKILNLGPPNTLNLPTPMSIRCYMHLLYCNIVHSHQYMYGLESKCRDGIVQFVYVQSNFNGSNTFGTIKISSRQGQFELMKVNYSARSGGLIAISF